MSAPSDPLDALKWALDHSDGAWWIVGAIFAAIAWTSKRLRDWGRHNAQPLGQSAPKAKAQAQARPSATVQWAFGASAPPPAAPPPPAAAPAASYAAAPSYTAAAYTAAAYAAQPAYAAPAAAQPGGAPHGGHSRKQHREAAPAQRPAAERAPAQRAAGPVVQPAAVKPAGGWSLSGAFGDPAHARTAIVIAEVLGPPVGLR
ncbi:MAG TPA: hypothetical protein VGC72_07020 [Candidatus Elarobacter sp.]